MCVCVCIYRHRVEEAEWKREKLPGDGYGGDSAGLSDGDESRFGVTTSVKNLRELRALT